MKPCFYAKSPGNEGYIKNMEVLAFHDLDGWAIFQMALYRKEGRYYLYGAGRGNPVWFGKRYFGALSALRGDIGGRSILAQHSKEVLFYPAEQAEVTDIDTPPCKS